MAAIAIKIVASIRDGCAPRAFESYDLYVTACYDIRRGDVRYAVSILDLAQDIYDHVRGAFVGDDLLLPTGQIKQFFVI